MRCRRVDGLVEVLERLFMRFARVARERAGVLFLHRGGDREPVPRLALVADDSRSFRAGTRSAGSSSERRWTSGSRARDRAARARARSLRGALLRARSSAYVLEATGRASRRALRTSRPRARRLQSRERGAITTKRTGDAAPRRGPARGEALPGGECPPASRPPSPRGPRDLGAATAHPSNLAVAIRPGESSEAKRSELGQGGQRRLQRPRAAGDRSPTGPPLVNPHRSSTEPSPWRRATICNASPWRSTSTKWCVGLDLAARRRQVEVPVERRAAAAGDHVLRGFRRRPARRCGRGPRTRGRSCAPPGARALRPIELHVRAVRSGRPRAVMDDREAPTETGLTVRAASSRCSHSALLALIAHSSSPSRKKKRALPEADRAVGVNGPVPSEKPVASESSRRLSS